MVVAAAFVAAIAAAVATVAAVVGWVVPGAVGDDAVRCIVHFIVVPSTLPVYPIQSNLPPCSLS